MKTQKKLGGFGQGVHGGDPFCSSACEDIDSIDPLARLMLAYLGKALPQSAVGKFDWRFCNCPGIQFWMQDRK